MPGGAGVAAAGVGAAVAAAGEGAAVAAVPEGLLLIVRGGKHAGSLPLR